MNTLLSERPYTQNDREEVICELLKYINNNNTYEHQLRNPDEPFVSNPNMISEDYMRSLTLATFPDSILIEAGNYLKTQSIFIANRMQHISSYLSRVGVKHTFLYFKPVDIVSIALMSRFMNSGSMGEVIGQTINSESCKYQTDPFNIFYKFFLLIERPNEAFMRDMDLLHGTKSDNDDRHRFAMIRFLPCTHIEYIDRVIRLIHKHF